jgi:hypothetical protein
MGLVLIGAGLFVLANAARLADLVSAYVSPPPDPAGGITGSSFSEGYFPFVVWGFGFSLIGSGAAVLKGGFTTSFGSGRSGLVRGGIEPSEMLNAYMQQAMSTVPTAVPQTPRFPPQQVVRVKCRNCGSLEAEDAAYCRKCGQPL